MNTYLIIANILTGLAFFAHTFAGDQELKLIVPHANDAEWLNKQEKWTMARCGWHWVSFDLLMFTIVLALINFTKLLPHQMFLVQLLAVYALGYAVFWLVTVAVSQSFTKNYIKLGQWILLLAISGLLLAGSM